MVVGEDEGLKLWWFEKRNPIRQFWLERSLAGAQQMQEQKTAYCSAKGMFTAAVILLIEDPLNATLTNTAALNS